ncbi:hypothetical protein L3V19_23365, partial [Vibrio parahaemolyticus]|nr:hypothetical protein [Vibrio parahaemolyticus]
DTPDLFIKPPGIVNAQSIRLVNSGATTVTLGDPVFTGPFGLATGQAWTCPPQLTPGGACTVGPIFSQGAPPGCPTGSFSTTTAAVEVP